VHFFAPECAGEAVGREGRGESEGKGGGAKTSAERSRICCKKKGGKENLTLCRQARTLSKIEKGRGGLETGKGEKFLTWGRRTPIESFEGEVEKNSWLRVLCKMVEKKSQNHGLKKNGGNWNSPKM